MFIVGQIPSNPMVNETFEPLAEFKTYEEALEYHQSCIVPMILGAPVFDIRFRRADGSYVRIGTGDGSLGCFEWF